MAAYETTRIIRQEVGPKYAKMKKTVYEQTVVQAVPADAVSLESLRAAEEARAAQASEFWGSSGLLGILIDGETGRTGRAADLSMAHLVRDLPSGSVVWEQIEPPTVNMIEDGQAFA